MSDTPTVWDPSAYLDDNDSISAYINEAIKDGDPKLITAAIGDVARAFGMTQLAKAASISREALYRALSDKGNPEFATVLAALGALDLTLHVTPKLPSSTEPTVQEVREAVVLRSGSTTTWDTLLIASTKLELNTFGTITREDIDAKRPDIGPTGPVSSAGIYPQIHNPGTAPAGPALRYADSVPSDVAQLGR